MQYDNPAARLLSILVDGKNIDVNQKCRRAWAGLLNVDASNGALLTSRIGKLMSLPQEIIDRTKEIYPGRAPTWDHWSTQVNNAFAAQNINGAWQTFISGVDNHTITYLQLSADLLETNSKIKKLDLDDLISLRNKIGELLAEVIGSEVDQSIKKYIVHHLYKILTAIDEYKITGSLPILDAVEATIGHAYLDQQYRKFLQGNEIGTKVLEVLGATADIVTVAIGIPQLTIGLLMLAKAD